MSDNTNSKVPGSVSDSGWILNKETSNPGRGIRDYDRTVSFKEELTMKQLSEVFAWLERNHCPGWTGINGKKLDPYNTYKFSTTMDSSD